jgi:hypothetical protein
MTPFRNRKRAIFAALACVVVLAVTILSFLPVSDKNALHTTGRFHSLGHLLAFSIVALLAARISRSVLVRILVLIGSLLLGFGIESAEHLVYHSLLEWKDVLVDALGVIGGTLIGLLTTPKETDSRSWSKETASSRRS